ncbi:GAF domain-containing protein [Azospirillum formosense]|uniref:histidine kinase n=1 Tax=Azospirillum formosense TaxID=861533 RepID=A0ABX2KNZ6_9PROT|nr:GAF domain-containing sensor histidine kinase [Azospirillum formosense]MBY3754574.1 GAF domain-containing sensor histidine kinase [Azospirillum formosense]NUB18356.1 GAF domain-containing protein [Azospirillum formosense]
MPAADTHALPPSALGDADHLTAIVDLGERLFFARDLPAVVSVLRATVRRLTGADGITIVLRDGDLCHYVEEDAISPLWKGQRFPMGTCISGWAMLTGQPAVIPDIYADPRIPQDAYRLTFVRSLVMVPVGAPEPIAAIGAYWAAQHTPDTGTVTLLRAIARSAALALSNVRLLASLQESAEAARAQAEQLARANAARTRLLATLNHDLRQPVHALTLATHALSSRVTGRGETYVSTMKHCLGVVKRLMDGVQDLAEMDDGTIAVRIEDVPLDDLMMHAAATFQLAAEAKGLGWRVEGSGGGVTVRTDRLLAARILHNLVDNAIKYTDRGEIRIACRTADDRVWVDVCDTGRGIPESSLADIFEEFYRIEAGDDVVGLGLGLFIVKTLSDHLGYPIMVKSRPGTGTTISIALPSAGSVAQPTGG